MLVLHLLKCLSTSRSIEINHLLEAHYLEERFRVHSLGGAKVRACLLQGGHSSADAVHGGNAGHQRED